jgi:hypothetical protein
MRFYTNEECEAWLAGRARKKPELDDGLAALRVKYPPEPYRIFYYAKWISESLTQTRPALLWITEWGIWPSSENWHLYSKLRQTFGDSRLLHESPGHYFLNHETSDLASFLQIAMLNGWGGYVLTEADYVNVFFSHDEYIDFYSKHPENLPDVATALGVEPIRRET